MTNLKSQLTHLTGGRLNDEELEDLVRFVESLKLQASKDERRRIEHEVWEAKHREWADHVQAIANTPIEVIADNGRYLTKEMITDIQRGAPDLIRVVIKDRGHLI